MQCLSNKIGILEKISCEQEIDFLCITEHWMMEEEISSQYNAIGGLRLSTGFCRSTLIHGGVAIYAGPRYDLSRIKVMHDLNNLSVELHCELACVEIVELKSVLVTVYRSPKGQADIFFNVIEQVLGRVNRLNRDLIICGDFNFHFLGNDKNADNMVNLGLMYGLSMTIFEPTRGNKILDNFFISSPITNDLVTEVLQFHISDHAGQLVTLKLNLSLVTKCRPTEACSISDLKYKEIIKLNDSDLRILKYYLNRESWNDVFLSENVNKCFDVFLNTLQYYFRVCFSVVKVRPKPSNKYRLNSSKPKQNNIDWYTNDLRSLKIYLDFLHDLLQVNSEHREYILQLYKKEKINYRLNIKQAKKKANAQFIVNSGNESKALWQIVNKQKRRNEPSNNLNAIKFSPNDFNVFFTNIASRVSIPGASSLDDVTSCMGLLGNKPTNLIFSDKFIFTCVTENCVLAVVNNLANKTSRDHFGMSNFLLKNIISCILSPFTRLINISLSQGIFPDILKITKVIPIHKKGDKDQMNNFRPIALVPVLSKIIEIIVGKQLMCFLEKNKLISHEQFGFRKGLSTTHALIHLVDEILESYEKKDFAAITFCDLSKAFDLVSHELLIRKLEYYHIKDTALSFFRSYLSDRLQYVSLNSTDSDRLPVSSGVPQGSVLGPLLFIVMINDLSVNVPAKTILYADDTTIINRNLNSSQALEIAKNNKILTENWLIANKLALNNEKTFTVLFGLRENLGAGNVYPKFLGLVLDPTLNWHQHAIGLKKKLSSGIFALKRLCGELSVDYVRRAYFGLIQSHLSYGLIVWGGAPIAGEIFLLQKKAIRTLTGLDRNDHCRPAFQNSRILTLYSLYILQCLLYLRTNIDDLQLRSAVHSHGTRSRHCVSIPKTRLLKSDMSPIIIASKLYNKLPQGVTGMDDTQFKRTVEHFLLNRAFYSLNEFLMEQWTIMDFIDIN